MPAPFGATWGTLLDRCEELPEDATLITPLSNKRFQITGVQQQRVVIEDTDTGDSQPLQRDQFEALAQHTRDSAGEGYELERLPPKAEPHAAVLALHPRYVLDQEAERIIELEEADESAILDDTPHLSTTTDDPNTARAEPDVPVYSDMLLLIDALEREDATVLEEIETPVLVNLYTLLSDVQRNANDLRKEVADILLERVQHDRPAHGQYGSVQRTTRRQRSLKDDETVLDAFESTGIARKQLLILPVRNPLTRLCVDGSSSPDSVTESVHILLTDSMSIAREKVDEALEVVSLPESAVYDIEESEYIRKAEVDEERKTTRLQGLKDRLAVSDDPEAEVLRQEVDRLEQRIEELTEFSPGSAFADGAE